MLWPEGRCASALLMQKNLSVTPIDFNMPNSAQQRGYAILIVLAIVTLASLYAVVSQLENRLAQICARGSHPEGARPGERGIDRLCGDLPDGHDNEVFGYLPCPDSSDKSGLYHPGDGTAAGSCGSAGHSAIGLLPYKTLGLPDLRDADGNCLWYAVSGSHKNSPKGSGASTPIPMNWDTQGQFSVKDQAGNIVGAPDDNQGGVVAVIFAPGAPLAGQMRVATSYPCSADPAQYPAYLDGAYSFPNAGATLVQGQPRQRQQQRRFVVAIRAGNLRTSQAACGFQEFIERDSGRAGQQVSRSSEICTGKTDSGRPARSCRHSQPFTADRAQAAGHECFLCGLLPAIRRAS